MRRRRSPYLGAVLDLDGQQFRCVRVRYALSRRGHAVPVLAWVGLCPDCGRPFEQRTSRAPRPRDVERRCPAHRGGRAERRASRASARILDSLAAELPDGNLVTMAGSLVERDPEPDGDGGPAWT